MGKIDLHVHTTASDGRFTPVEIVQKAVEYGLSHIAITDHDALDGIGAAMQAAEAYPWLTVIAGVEINTDVSSGELHVIGYFIDYYNQELIDTLERLRDSRVERARKMVEKLKKLGVYIEMERVKELAGSGAVGRPHIARAMQEKGYIREYREAFSKYIGRDAPAYVERDKINPVEAVKLVKRARGLPVLGHPFTFENPEAMLAELKPLGLAGIEAYYDGYTAEQVSQLVELADKYDLVPTGGSDYHGVDPLNETSLGGSGVPQQSVERLIALARR
ncbi:MAG: PHP domain-containing protein [Dehalococcoidia bacterium]|nr:PHP domain-containing protein [Dehalococcoidia bacterium]